MIYLLSLIAVAARFLPHPPNFACIGALGLFAGCYMAGRKAYLVPIAVLGTSDLIGHFLGIPGMGFYRPEQMTFVYLGMFSSVAIGRIASAPADNHGSASVRWGVLPMATLSASAAFFVISNIGVWLGPWYSTNFAGLIACFTAAIPFFGYTVAGDFFFAAAMFGAYEFSRRYSASRHHGFSSAYAG